MPTQEESIRRIVNNLLEQGYEPGRLKEAMLKKGYPEALTLKIFSEIKKVKPAKELITEKPKIEHKTLQSSLKIVFAVVFLILAGTFSYRLFSEQYLGRCSSGDCLIAKANECQAAVFFEDVEGSTLRLSADNCVLTKEFAEFADSEPFEVVELFSGKKMECPYEKGHFTSNYLGLLGNIEQCRGSLKDSILEVRIAQFELLEK